LAQVGRLAAQIARDLGPRQQAARPPALHAQA